MFYPHKNVDCKRKKEAKKEKVVIVVYLFINLQCKPKGPCYLPLQFAVSFSSGRTNTGGLLFVILYFYIFIQQRLGSDTAMNSLLAAIPDRYLQAQMTNQSRKILFIAYAFIGLLTESLISYLFPYTGLGGLICYPISIILSLLFGWTIYKITKLSLKPFLVGLTFFVFISLQFIVELYVHPQDFGGTTFQQITNCKRAYKNYDNISFESFPEISGAKRVAYIYKFKRKLPLSISILSIDTSEYEFASQVSRKYMILNFAHDTTYDTTLLKLIRTDTSLVIIENPKESSKTKVHVTDKFFLNNSAGGVIDRTNSIIYNIQLDTFEIDTGLKKLFYKYLRWTKKPAGNNGFASMAADE